MVVIEIECRRVVSFGMAFTQMIEDIFFFFFLRRKIIYFHRIKLAKIDLKYIV